jgi:hypothetical protein
MSVMPQDGKPTTQQVGMTGAPFDVGKQKEEEAAPQVTAQTVNADTDQGRSYSGTKEEVDAKIEADKAEGFEVAEYSETGVTKQEDPEITRLKEEANAQIQELLDMKDKLQDLYITDKELRGEVRAIGKIWDARIKEMEDITRRQVASTRTTGIRHGAQFTGGIGGAMGFGGLIGAVEREGIRKIGELEAQKQSAILEAKNAARNFNYKLYSELIDVADTLSQRKAKELADLKKAQAEKDAEIADKKRNMIIESAVVLAVEEGFDSVSDVYNALNYDESGKFTGGYSLKEIEAAMKIANPAKDMSELDGELAEFEYLKSINDPSVEGLNYIQFRRAVYNATHSSGGGTTGDLSDKYLTVEQLEYIEAKYGRKLPPGTKLSEVKDLLGEDVDTGEGGGTATGDDVSTAEGWLRQNLQHDQLKSLSDWADESSAWTPSTYDINRFFRNADDTDIIGLYEVFQKYPDKKKKILELLNDDKSPLEIAKELSS